MSKKRGRPFDSHSSPRVDMECRVHGRGPHSIYVYPYGAQKRCVACKRERSRRRHAADKTRGSR